MIIIDYYNVFKLKYDIIHFHSPAKSEVNEVEKLWGKYNIFLDENSRMFLSQLSHKCDEYYDYLRPFLIGNLKDGEKPTFYSLRDEFIDFCSQTLKALQEGAHLSSVIFDNDVAPKEQNLNNSQ